MFLINVTDASFCSTFNNGGVGAQPVFAQYLKASKNPKYTISQINTYPTTTSAVQVVTTLIYACK
jgi:ACS family pantothenate transporter-like MFS transporter